MHEHTAPPTGAQDADVELEAIMERSARALARLGIDADALLDELPAAREEVLREIYGVAYMREIEQEFRSFRERQAQEPPVSES